MTKALYYFTTKRQKRLALLLVMKFGIHTMWAQNVCKERLQIFKLGKCGEKGLDLMLI